MALHLSSQLTGFCKCVFLCVCVQDLSSKQPCLCDYSEPIIGLKSENELPILCYLLHVHALF